ncbi:hypothetical protein [Agromyces salentinus]|uniref:Uncharacterized protein n=1 Tax=Agromyces salentinus TaxID=269421 RepID=A0ABP4Z3U0_9MICO|nr:hypothetical protein [Agromyces salentinus]
MTERERERVALDPLARAGDLDGPDAFDDLDDLDEATVVVDRGADADADATVVVDRTGRTAGASDGRPDGQPTDDAVDEATVVVARSDAPAETDDAEATRVVVRAERAERAEPAEPALTHAAEQIMKAPTRRDRRRPAPAPVSDDVLRTAEPGIGPGLAGHYAAREVEVPTPSPQPVVPAGPPPTRDATTALPSVARRSRRSAVVVIAAFAAACAVAVAGLAAVAVAAIGALAG